MNTPSTSPAADLMQADDFDALDAILDDLRTRREETPEWEFCEGFMAALICCRRAIAPAEYLPVLLGGGETPDLEPGAVVDLFADEAQFTRFTSLWTRRWNEVVAAIDTEVEALDEDRAYAPEVMDVRGAIASLPTEEREQLANEALPAFAQIWAFGFMAVVEGWPQEWVPPRDREAAEWLDECLDAIVTLTGDDEDEPTLSALSEDGPPSVSESRLEAYGEAIWSVYDLRALWRGLGPRVETVRKEPAPGRNDPCPCGSGKKYKKCHGAVG